MTHRPSTVMTSVLMVVNEGRESPKKGKTLMTKNPTIHRMRQINSDLYQRQGIISVLSHRGVVVSDALDEYLESFPDFTVDCTVSWWIPYTHVVKAIDPLYGDDTYYLVEMADADDYPPASIRQAI